MRDSEFLAKTLDYMGSPDKWCQNALITTIDAGPGSVGREVLAAMTEEELLDNPELIGSMCMEGAIVVVEHQVRTQKHWPVGTSPQARRIRKRLHDMFVEQFPDLVDEMMARKAQAIRILYGDDLQEGRSVLTPKSFGLPSFNDHEAMTYEGVRSVVEKTVAKLQEEGR